MIRTYRQVIGSTLAILVSFVAFAGEPAGMVKTSRGQVGIERDGQRLLAVVGTPVLVGDRVRTGGDGAVGVTLRDNTLLSAGPNSLIAVDKFKYDNLTQDGSMSIGVGKGTLAVATGRIAKRTPESIDFHTPTSVLGVRGTEFAVEVEGSRDD